MDTTRPWARVLSGSFPAFVLLQGSLYAAYGTVSPFLPSFLGERGLTPGEIGSALAAGTLMRIAAGPVIGYLADRYDAMRGVLGITAAASGLIAFAYLTAYGFWPMLVVSVLHAGAIAALGPLADALALAAARREGHSPTAGSEAQAPQPSCSERWSRDSSSPRLGWRVSSCHAACCSC